jgi:hypothetical protein
MMRRAALLTALTLSGTASLSTLPGAAAAKEISSLNVCGTDGCHSIKAHAALRGFLDGGYETPAPARNGAFFAVKVRMRYGGQDAGGPTVQYLPAANLIRAEADFGKHAWTRPAGATAAALRRAARGLRPYPAEELAPVRDTSPAPAASPPARVSRPAPGGGSSRLGLAGGAGVLLATLAAAGIAVRRRRAG